jgi:hypothetical protein
MACVSSKRETVKVDLCICTKRKGLGAVSQLGPYPLFLHRLVLGCFVFIQNILHQPRHTSSKCEAGVKT